MGKAKRHAEDLVIFSLFPRSRRMRLNPILLLPLILVAAGYYIISPSPSKAVSTTILITEVEADPKLSGVDDANEWFELKNVSASAITLSGWTITDNTSSDTIPAITLGPGQCVIVAATASGFQSEHHNNNHQVLAVADGEIGNGLNNTGDRLILKDNNGTAVDCVSWGSDTTCFSPAVSAPSDNTDQTIQRTSDTDTDTKNDWAIATETPCSNPPTALTLGHFAAISHGNVTRLQWQTGYEVSNLGFNLYREQDGRWVRLNPSIIAGSALFVGSNTELTAGRSYSWLDPHPQPGAQYWLEAIDLSGEQELYGPVLPVPESTDLRLPDLPQSKLLNQLTTDQPMAKTEAGQREWPTQVSGSLIDGFATSPPRRLLRAVTAASVELPPLQQQWALAGQSSIKLAVNRNGWYRVTQPELLAAGLNPNVDPRKLQLFVRGVEVPIAVTSAQPARFGPNDYIEFYGQALDTPATDTQIYWLSAGSKAGKRIAVNSAPASVSPSIRSFWMSVERKERLVYFASLLNGETENFFGQVLSGRSAPVEQKLNLKHLDTEATTPAQLEVALQGVTYQAHQVRVQINEADAGTLSFANRDHAVVGFSFPHSVLRAGENTIKLTVIGGETDVSLLDYLRLTYARTYHAENDVLSFSVAAAQSVRVSGFSNPHIRVFDITEPDAVQELAVQPLSEATGYGFSLYLPTTRILLALTDQRYERPAMIAANEPSSWHQFSSGANLVLITHRDFRASVQPLVELRESQGWKVVVVDVEDLYDEFSYGAHSPQAIKDFLFQAHHLWSPPPRYLLLVGDGSLDPRNYLKKGYLDLVPARLIDTALMETASDDWFADFDGDGMAELAVGRLPVRTPAEANAVISKIVSFTPESESRSVVLVSDRQSGYDFEAASDQLRSLLPVATPVRAINRNEGTTEAVRARIIEAINQGPLLVNYLGHGSVDLWTGEGLLRAADASALQNRTALSFFTLMTCLNGYFQDPVLESLAEALLKAQGGGAVAVWASSGMTEPAPQMILNQELYRHLFSGQVMTLGEAIIAAKTAVFNRDLRQSWVLLGDPAMSLLPGDATRNADLVVGLSATSESVIPGSGLGYAITVTNHGPAAANSMMVTATLSEFATVVSCIATGGGSCAISGNRAMIGHRSLAAGATLIINLGVKVSSVAAPDSILINQVTSSAQSSDPIRGNNSATVAVRVAGFEPLRRWLPRPPILAPRSIAGIK